MGKTITSLDVSEDKIEVHYPVECTAEKSAVFWELIYEHINSVEI